MTEPVPQPPPPKTLVAPVDPERELARKNLAWGWALFGLCWLLFAGTILVAFAYLWLD